MTDTNYTPDEIRLLDEFAAAYLTGSHYNPWHQGADPDRRAEVSYDAAAAMIAERRKRVGKQIVSYRGIPVMEENPLSEPVAQPEPTTGTFTVDISKLPKRRYVTAADVVDAAQPQPEKSELTEEAVQEWVDETHPQYGANSSVIGIDERARAVALMREGLRAKEELDHARGQVGAEPYQRLEHAIQEVIDGLAEDLHKAEEERDEARRILRSCMVAINDALGNPAVDWSGEPSIEEAVASAAAARLTELTKECDEARATLAEAQPVLDAVVVLFPIHACYWASDPWTTLQAYADRRREQAKGAS